MASIDEKAKALDIKGVILTLVVSSFGFVMALFWRDAVKEAITKLVPEGEGLMYSFAAAIAVTIICVVAIYIVSKYMSTSIRKTVKETMISKEGRAKIKERIKDIDNRLVGRDIAIRRKKQKT